MVPGAKSIVAAVHGCAAVLKGKNMQDEEDPRPRIKVVKERKEKFVRCDECVFRDYIFKEDKAGGLQDIKLDCLGADAYCRGPKQWVRTCSDTNLFVPFEVKKGCWYGLEGQSLSQLPLQDRTGEERHEIIVAYGRLKDALVGKN